MKFYDDRLVERVRTARKLGSSLRDLSQKFSVPNTTVSRWVRDIQVNDSNFLRSQAKTEESKNKYKGVVNSLRINKNLSMLLASLLYWCEGSKYPASNVLAFSNSDWKMVRSFLTLLRNGFGIDERKVRVHLQLHTTHSKKSVFSFWSDLLNVKLNQFYRPTITKPTRTMKRRNYLGTCTIKYFDVKLLLQLSGIFDSLANKIGEVPEWSNGTRC